MLLSFRARARWLGPLALALLLVRANPASASTSNVQVAATILSGTRTMTTAALSAPLASAGRAASVSTTLNVVVTETAVDGADWTVTARLCGPNNTTTPSAPDCATYGDKLVKSGGDATTVIAGSNLTLSGVSVTPAVVSVPSVAATTTALSGSPDLSQARTLLSTTGQSGTSIYTGTYTSSATVTLNVPTTAASGTTYNGYVVLTLTP
jgi:hypothetical protein